MSPHVIDFLYRSNSQKTFELFVNHLSRNCINGMTPKVLFRRLKRFLPLPSVTRSNNGNDNQRSDLEISVMCYMELIAVYPR